jgi:hypothetical protein
MASEMTSAFREFALKKLNEAKQRGATLATVATASISSNVNVAVPATATSFVFRSNATRQHEKEPLALDRKLSVLRALSSPIYKCSMELFTHCRDEWHAGEANAALKKTASDHATETLDDAVSKIDLVNESLAYSIENVQVLCACYGCYAVEAPNVVSPGMLACAQDAASPTARSRDVAERQRSPLLPPQ